MMAIQGESQERGVVAFREGSTEVDRAGSAGTGALHDRERDHRGVDIGVSEAEFVEVLGAQGVRLAD
jgi:hypothetical protein